MKPTFEQAIQRMNKNEKHFDFWWNYFKRPCRIVSSKINELMKWHNAILIQREVNRHRYEMVISDFGRHIVRLIGWTDQYEDDYYWVYWDGRKVGLLSCVGGFQWLKYRLSMFEYYSLDCGFERNNPIEYAFKIIKRMGVFVK